MLAEEVIVDEEDVLQMVVGDVGDVLRKMGLQDDEDVLCLGVFIQLLCEFGIVDEGERAGVGELLVFFLAEGGVPDDELACRRMEELLQIDMAADEVIVAGEAQADGLFLGKGKFLGLQPFDAFGGADHALDFRRQNIASPHGLDGGAMGDVEGGEAFFLMRNEKLAVAGDACDGEAAVEAPSAGAFHEVDDLDVRIDFLLVVGDPNQTVFLAKAFGDHVVIDLFDAVRVGGIALEEDITASPENIHQENAYFNRDESE